jgi:5-methylcytosine-specific restriction endonuclease McrA
MIRDCKRLNFGVNLFICTDGYVFKIEDGREIKVRIRQHHKSKTPIIKIGPKVYKLLDLMLEYFMPDIKIVQKVTYKCTRELHIPLRNIVRKTIVSDGFSEADLIIMQNFRCSQKASSANLRGKGLLTAVDVFLVLQHFEYKCIYCAGDLLEDDWHLDHYIPIAKGGSNSHANIVPSCSMCNTMKGAFHAGQFYNQCRRIYDNFYYRNDKKKPTTS